jgi:ADP-sugar diphosphatase
MLDGSTLTGTAASEIEQEASLKVLESELINLSALALATDPNPTSSAPAGDVPEQLKEAMYPSPGACDEFIPLLLCQKRLTARHMAWLQGRATGLRDEGERIKLKLVPLGRVWREAGRDGKALAAVALYEGLRREGRIGNGPREVEVEPEEVVKGG